MSIIKMATLSQIIYQKCQNFLKFATACYNHGPRNFAALNTFESFKKDYNRNHIYLKRMTESDVIKEIVGNIVYKNEDFIVTSKPYGVGKSKNIEKPDEKVFTPQTFVEIYLEDIMPKVAEILGYKSLQIVKMPERYASGIMILTITEKGHKEILKSLNSAKQSKKFINSYIAVTVGCLALKEKNTKFAVQIKKNKNGSKYPVILDTWSKKSLKHFKVRLVSWNHTVESHSNLASLVRVNISNTHNNSLKLYLATKCLSPVLGDAIFGKNVLKIFGVPVLTNASPSEEHSKSFLCPELMSTLLLEENEISIIPSHVHLNAVTLPLKQQQDITFRVPPPETFIWTCNQLNLKLTDNENAKSN